MSIQRTVSATEDYIAQVDLFTTGDGPGTEIVGEGDYRARFLLARKGTAIPGKLAKRLAIDENFKLPPVIREDPNAQKKIADLRLQIGKLQAHLDSLLSAGKTISPEEISARSTRPEKPAAQR